MHQTITESSALVDCGGSHAKRRMATLALGALGVVYGDIGTSPLYALQATFASSTMAVTSDNVLGVLSLMFWSLVVIVSVKYVSFVMRADNKGEGGIMALMALAQHDVARNQRAVWWVVALGLVGASLFYGDGVITPAISVLSAVEGLEVAAPSLARFVVPLTVAIIVLMFWLQKRGTHRVGMIFGPVMIVWFLSLATLGAISIAGHPQVLWALSPHEAIAFFLRNRTQAYFDLGAIVLAVTGAEALYADMGHFGRAPIRRAWFAFVLPALVLNYFGQGALLLAQPKAVSNPFYFLVPAPFLYPMIALATAATIIASQAVISGAFSMTREAIQLGYLPRMKICHTSRVTQGQIYIPAINRILMVFVIAAVIGFGSSAKLGSAYGIAVTGTMSITTLLTLIVARAQWGWSLQRVVLVGALMLTVDLAFFSANMLKIASGGWFPLALGIGVFTVMATWKRGRKIVRASMEEQGLELQPFIASLAISPPHRVPGTAIFLSPNPNHVPQALLHNLKHNKVLHAQNVIVSVETLDVPFVESSQRCIANALGNDFHQLRLRYGFAEEPNVPDDLARACIPGLSLEAMQTSFFSSRESLETANGGGITTWREHLFATIARNATPATDFFHIPGNRLVELGSRVAI
ncbi:MAG: potassium transporter Kup [Lysobacteraceae bacterium]